MSAEQQRAGSRSSPTKRIRVLKAVSEGSDLRTADQPPIDGAKLLAGSYEEWNRFAARYWRWLTHLFPRLGVDVDDAEDVTQDLMDNLFRKRGHFDPGRLLHPYVMQCARNHAKDYLRKRRRRPEHTVEDIDALPGCTNISGEFEERDTRDRAMARMRPADRQAYMLIRLEGHTYDEAAEITGRSRDALKVSVSRAVRVIRDLDQ